MDNWKKEAVEKGEKTESKFKKWLDKNNINYLYIKQSIESFPKSFNEYLKRPDFIIFVPNIGMIMVDVKRRDITKKYNDISIDVPDLIKYNNFQNKFHIALWYAFSNENLNYDHWYWLPASDALRHYKNFKDRTRTRGFKSPKSKKPYFPIKLNNFIKINNNDSLGKIFSNNF